MTKKIFDFTFMQAALDLAQKAFELDEVPVGAVIVDSKEKKIVSYGFNQSESTKNPLMHAEVIAINNIINKKKSLNGHDIYITLEPCLMCLGAINLAKLDRLFFGAYDQKFSHLNCKELKNKYHESVYYPKESNHKLDIYGGIMEEESSFLLKNFFNKKRG